VTPAKHPEPIKLQKDDFSDFGFDVPPEFGSFASTQPQPQQTQTQTESQPQQSQQVTRAAPLSLSSFDDVFASFDRPSTLTPPTLPLRNPSPDDDPNLRTLTGISSSIHSNIEMGFTRAKAVEALEKHNYNLDNVILYPSEADYRL